MTEEWLFDLNCLISTLKQRVRLIFMLAGLGAAVGAAWAWSLPDEYEYTYVINFNTTPGPGMNAAVSRVRQMQYLMDLAATPAARALFGAKFAVWYVDGTSQKKAVLVSDRPEYRQALLLGDRSSVTIRDNQLAVMFRGTQLSAQRELAKRVTKDVLESALPKAENTRPFSSDGETVTGCPGMDPSANAVVVAEVQEYVAREMLDRMKSLFPENILGLADAQIAAESRAVGLLELRRAVADERTSGKERYPVQGMNRAEVAVRDCRRAMLSDAYRAMRSELTSFVESNIAGANDTGEVVDRIGPRRGLTVAFMSVFSAVLGFGFSVYRQCRGTIAANPSV